MLIVYIRKKNRIMNKFKKIQMNILLHFLHKLIIDISLDEILFTYK